MTTKLLETENLAVTELSLDDLDQATGGGYHGGDHNQGVFYGLLGAGLAIAGGIILIGLFA